MTIEQLVKEAKISWWHTSSHYTSFKGIYTKDQDKALIHLQKHIVNYIQNLDFSRADEPDAHREMLITCKEFMVQTLGLSAWAANQLFDEDYLKCSQSFIKRVREQTPNLEVAGIFQALRNIWTMNSMQLYLGKKIELTNSMYAYSMLYPLTDNYLDSPTRTKAQKQAFNHRFAQKIETGYSSADTPEEELIFHMIDLIESDFDRSLYPQVYEALLGILKGQQESLHQHNIKNAFTVDLLEISILKGGTSVLADAYLVAGHLTPKEAQFAFNYGVLLQLADDLQDICEDRKNNQFTLFNIENKEIDETLFKYMNLMDHFFKTTMSEDHANQKALKEIMALSLRLLIYTALLKNKKCISRDLYALIKVSHTFSLRTYKKVERQFTKQLNTLLKHQVKL